MKLSRKYIWDYEIKKSDLKKPGFLKWYLERKIEYGDGKRWIEEVLKEIGKSDLAKHFIWSGELFVD
jgi:hypothetical protein